MKEIERKFLVDKEALSEEHPKLDQFASVHIAQGYLLSGPEGSARVRQKGDSFFLTVKVKAGEDRTERYEVEPKISKETFDEIWPATEGRRVEKVRYHIPLSDMVEIIELDVFEGDLEGRMLAEVEFRSLDEAKAFQPPAWFGQDVTENPAYTNAAIAENGWPE